MILQILSLKGVICGMKTVAYNFIVSVLQEHKLILTIIFVY